MNHIVWLRNELRLEDNPALYNAALDGAAVLPVYVCPGEQAGLGSASRWWLHHSLQSLSGSLKRLGVELYIARGNAAEVLPALAEEYGAEAVFWSRTYDPLGQAEEASVEVALSRKPISCRTFAGANHLISPAEILNKSGAPFKVFTPFYKHASTLMVTAPVAAPTRITPVKGVSGGVPLAELALLPAVNWATGIQAAWVPGEAGALERLQTFLDGSWAHYSKDRDFPGQEGTSKLSPHLRFGEISPRTVLHALWDACNATEDKTLMKAAEVFIRQLYWREFAHHLLFHFPHMLDKPMYPEFEQFPWREDNNQLRAWQEGRTGYPIVDAGMRELWHTGWMHNRVRMIVGSFLVKDLLLPWQAGAAWFWDTLVDADWANNTLGWQWVGGCGPDAAPYFRIFNPMLQSKRFDPEGQYIKRWLPELQKLDKEQVHAPWLCSLSDLEQAGVVPGENYPHPLVDHFMARDRALEAYSTVKAAKAALSEGSER